MTDQQLAERSDVEARVLRAARKLFLKRGVSKTPLRAIAAEAGTSESGILRFFRDKEDLAQAVIDWCWSDVVNGLKRVVKVASKQTSDPREVLVEVVRRALENAAAERERTRFLVGHFSYNLSGWSGGDDRAHGRPRFKAYCEYRSLVENLCGAVIAAHPELVDAGLTHRALCHFVLSMLYGITGGWFLSECSPSVHGPMLGIDEAVALFRKVVYPDEECRALAQAQAACEGSDLAESETAQGSGTPYPSGGGTTGSRG